LLPVFDAVQKAGCYEVGNPRIAEERFEGLSWVGSARKDLM
jgi:hypothetical protein